MITSYLAHASLLEAPTVVNREAEGTSALDSQDAASAGGASGTAVAVGIVVPVAVIMLACAGWYFVRIRQKGVTVEATGVTAGVTAKVTVEATGVTAGDDAKTDYVSPALSGVDPALIVDESKVTLGRVLGAGGSGVVKQGTLELRRGRSVDVAVKMISTGNERLFESEVTSMCVRVRACVRACVCVRARVCVCDKCVLAHFSFLVARGAAVRLEYQRARTHPPTHTRAHTHTQAHAAVRLEYHHRSCTIHTQSVLT